MIMISSTTIRTNAARAILILAIALLPSLAVARIQIEKAQRELQARHIFIAQHPVWAPFNPNPVPLTWPDCRSCGSSLGKAPPYPKDGFYGADLDQDDPEFAAKLVDDLIYQFYNDGGSYHLYQHFVDTPDGNVEGRDPNAGAGLNYTIDDFPNSNLTGPPR